MWLRQVAESKRNRLVVAALVAGLVSGASAARLAADPHGAVTAFERELGARLARAVQAGHRSELARLGSRAGARGLRAILIEPTHQASGRAARLAAVLAAPAAEDAWDLLAPLAAPAAGPDRLLAASASSSAALIATRLHRDWHAIYDAKDIAPATLATARQSWLDLAADPGRWVDVRVLALETGVSLDRALLLSAGGAGSDAPRGSARALVDVLAGFAADNEPALRRAAFELMDAPLEPALRALAGRAVGDPDPEVALAAAQALCSGLDLGAEPAPILAALDEPARARLRALIAVAAHPPAARIDAARCLAAAGDAQSRRALDALRASLPRDLRGLTPREPSRRRSQDDR
jgi:hypothetical protein